MTDATTPALRATHIVRRDHLAARVCHDEQMTIWESELLEDLSEFLLDPADQDEVIAMRSAANRAIRNLIAAVFSHPELLD